MTAKLSRLKIVGPKTTGLAVLLALFVAACQPAAKTSTETATAAPEASPSAAPPASTEAATELAQFKAGKLSKLDFSFDTSLPAVPVVDAAGKKRVLTEYKGKVVVLNQWGEWCGPCVTEMPSLAALQKAFPDGDVVVVPVAVGDGKDIDKTKAKLKQLAGDTLPFFYDATWDVSYAIKTQAFPSTLIYNREGQEVARLVVDGDWGSPEAIALVKAVVEGKS